MKIYVGDHMMGHTHGIGGRHVQPLVYRDDEMWFHNMWTVDDFGTPLIIHRPLNDKVVFYEGRSTDFFSSRRLRR